MSGDLRPLLSGQALRVLGRQAHTATPCSDCAGVACPGWDSMPGSFPRDRLRCVGTLRDPNVDEPSYVEHHPAGTHAWSADAPIAPGFFPYNRCDVFQCPACERAFLRYTEYGGYYEDERIRLLDGALVVDASS